MSTSLMRPFARFCRRRNISTSALWRYSGFCAPTLWGLMNGPSMLMPTRSGTLAVFVGGRGIHDAVQDLFGECHGGGADGQHALAGLKIRQRLDGFFLAVTEILAHGTVEVDIHEARQGIEALCVQNFFALLGGSKGHNAALPDNDAPPFQTCGGGV